MAIVKTIEQVGTSKISAFEVYFQSNEYIENGSLNRRKVAPIQYKQEQSNDFITTIIKGVVSLSKAVLFEEIINDDIEPLLTTFKNDNEQFKEVSEIFAFNKSEWAKIFNVSRVTIYDWLNGKTKPAGDNADKIRNIYKILNSLGDNRNSIYQTYLYQNISKYNKSLMEIFSSSQNIEKDYENLDKVIMKMIKLSQQRRERISKLTKTKLPKEDVLKHNLEDLGLL